MELKLRFPLPVRVVPLVLIVPYGIETRYKSPPQYGHTVLIVPYGIET